MESLLEVGQVVNTYGISIRIKKTCFKMINWTKYGEDNTLISNTQRYKCLGNAVTTNVIQYIIDNWNIGNKYEDIHR